MCSTGVEGADARAGSRSSPCRRLLGCGRWPYRAPPRVNGGLRVRLPSHDASSSPRALPASQSAWASAGSPSTTGPSGGRVKSTAGVRPVPCRPQHARMGRARAAAAVAAAGAVLTGSARRLPGSSRSAGSWPFRSATSARRSDAASARGALMPREGRGDRNAVRHGHRRRRDRPPPPAPADPTRRSGRRSGALLVPADDLPLGEPPGGDSLGPVGVVLGFATGLRGDDAPLPAGGAGSIDAAMTRSPRSSACRSPPRSSPWSPTASSRSGCR